MEIYVWRPFPAEKAALILNFADALGYAVTSCNTADIVFVNATRGTYDIVSAKSHASRFIVALVSPNISEQSKSVRSNAGASMVEQMPETKEDVRALFQRIEQKMRH